MSSYGHSTDAEDLKLKFSRFLCFSLHIKSDRFYLCRSPRFSFFSGCSEAEQKSPHSCTNSCTRTRRTSGLKRRRKRLFLGFVQEFLHTTLSCAAVNNRRTTRLSSQACIPRLPVRLSAIMDVLSTLKTKSNVPRKIKVRALWAPGITGIGVVRCEP